MGLFSSVINLLFPQKCVFCSNLAPSIATICDKCQTSLPFTENGGKQTGNYFDLCVSPLFYSGQVRKSILRFKFRGKSMYAESYGKLLADCIKNHLDIGYDIITWVPLSRNRAKTRGYDQSMLLAYATALELNDVAAETLKKTKEAVAQSTLNDPQARKDNIAGAYTVLDPELIEDKCVLLIDDIITTGSTISECAKTLLQAGASQVVCATLARSAVK